MLAAPYDRLTADDVPATFDKLVLKLSAELVRQAEAPPQQEPSPLYEGPMLDWRALEDSDAPAHCTQARYQVKLQRCGHQFFLDIAPEHAHPDELPGQHQLQLFIEVNDGLPCVHLGNELYGDKLLTVFSTSDGLYLRPDESDLWIRNGVPGEDLPHLQAQYERETAEPFSQRSAMNHAFLVAPNR